MSKKNVNYTQFPNIILDRVAELSGSESKVLMFFVRQTFGWHKDQKVMSLNCIANGVQLSVRVVIKTVKSLVEKGIVEQQKGIGLRGAHGYKLLVDDLLLKVTGKDDNDLLLKVTGDLLPKVTSHEFPIKDVKKLIKETPIVPKENVSQYHPETKAILTYLIEKTGRPFSLECKSSLKFISSRLSEPGVTVAGVRQMIDRQCILWMGGEMQQYLRPETLFNATKFDSYYSAKDLPVKPYAAQTTTAPQIVNRNIGTYNEGQPSLVPYAEAIAAKRLAESADLRRAFRMAEQAKSEMLRRSQPGTTADGMCPVG
jgi:phage replication O-like protein O